MGVLGHGRPPPPPGETTCKTQNPATSALRAPESACRPQALKLHPRPEVRRTRPPAAGTPRGPGAPRLRGRACAARPGGAWAPRGPSAHSTGLSMVLRCGARRGQAGCPAGRLAVLHPAAPPRPLRLHVAALARLFAARAVALATSRAPPAPGARPRLPALPRVRGSPRPQPPAAPRAGAGLPRPDACSRLFSGFR